MDGKHTPGNWMAASRPSSVVGWPIVASPSGRVIANLAWMPGLSPELEAEIGANARLIAAAPELLEALKEAVDLIVHITRSRWSEWEETEDETVGEFRAAIAKASPTPPVGEGEAR